VTRLLFLLLGTIVLGLLLWHLGPGEILRTFAQLGWHSLPILICYVIYQVMRAAALRFSILRWRRVSFRDALWIRLSGDAMQSLTFTGPFLGEPTKAWLLKSRGLTLTEGFAATLTEYLINLILSAAMSVGALLYLLRAGTLPPPAAGAAEGLLYVSAAFLVTAVVAIGLRVYIIGSVIEKLGRIGVLRGRLKPDVPAINRMEDLLLGVLRDRLARAAVIVLVEIGAQAALVLEIAWILYALGLAAPAIHPLIIEAAAKFTTVAFFFVPLQVGASEGAFAVIFVALGLPAAAGFSLAFFRRLRSLLIASAGLAALDRLTRQRSPSDLEPD
jgi:glycosyltransferase 2 family protein